MGGDKNDDERRGWWELDLAVRTVYVLIPVGMAVLGWALTLETRLQSAIARQEERGPRINRIEEELYALRDSAKDPSTRVRIESVQRELDELRKVDGLSSHRLDRIEERLNALHTFIIQRDLDRMRSEEKRETKR